jgi:hypothetical protein
MNHIQYKSQQFYKVCEKIGKALLALGVLFAMVMSSYNVQALNVYDRYIQISNSIPQANGVVYSVGFTMPSAQTLGSVVIEICDNSPLYSVACVQPNGFSWLSATLNSESGATGFSIDPSTTANRMVLTRAPGPVAAGTVQRFSFNNVTNPYDSGTFYGKIFTYATNDATGPDTDFGGVAMSLNDSMSVQTEVPPYLYFCSGITIDGFDCLTATGSYINLGELSKTGTIGATSQMVAATNADFGYNITVSGTTLTSGINVIPNLTTPSSPAPGSSRFGINLRANSNPGAGQDVSGGGVATPTADYNTPNQYKFKNEDTIAQTPDVSLENKFTVTYMVNVSPNQAPGIYNSTLIYNILATF